VHDADSVFRRVVRHRDQRSVTRPQAAKVHDTSLAVTCQFDGARPDAKRYQPHRQATPCELRLVGFHGKNIEALGADSARPDATSNASHVN
jgi:hypothetical protein